MYGKKGGRKGSKAEERELMTLAFLRPHGFPKTPRGCISADSPGQPWVSSTLGPHLLEWGLPGSREGGSLPAPLPIRPRNPGDY